MSSYFKHTAGESFTLNGSDYVGFFHVLSGIAYSETKHTDNSDVLDAKNTFISDVYINTLEFDVTYKNIDDIKPLYSNSFDLLNKQGLDRIVSTIDTNNTTSYKNLVIGHPTIFKFEENNGQFYGLSSTNEEDAQTIPFKKCYGNIIPFSETINYSFLDDITTGTFVVNSRDDFKYLCSDGNTNYILHGGFSNGSPLKVAAIIPNVPYYNETHAIYNDTENSKFLFVKNDHIEVYDSSNYDDCDTLILIDEISLIPTNTKEFIWDSTDILFDEMVYTYNTKYHTDNQNNPKFIKFGYNIRTGISDNVLTLYNKYSSDIVQSIDLNEYNVGDVLSIDIRSEDDCILILNIKNNDLYVCFIDPNNLSPSFNKVLLSVDVANENQKIEFSQYDSNIFTLSNTKEYQTRYISNPTYPSGRLETADLYYLRDYIWDTTDEFFNFVNIPWDAANIKSNKFNNLTVSNVNKFDNMYMLLHNVGRLYALKQPMNDRFLNFIPLNLQKYFEDSKCSNSSVGLYINSALSTLLKDTLNLFNKSTSSFTIEERAVIYSQIKDFILESQNLYINGNESINVIALQRIMLTITDIQRKLLPTT